MCRSRRGRSINYVVSKGPEPTPIAASPTPSPTPHADADTHTGADARPRRPADPVPTVGDYRCLTLGEATTQVEEDGFTVGASCRRRPTARTTGSSRTRPPLRAPSGARNTDINFTAQETLPDGC